nr:hypothetical protein GCM10017745_48510 [Saccharothrix mutabilis subsp. capreolus]
MVVLVGAVPAVSLARWLPSHVACRDGWPSGEVWSQDGECVGVTEGPYAFELDQFTRVMAVIDEQNRTVRDHGCRSDHPIVTIAVLTTFTSPHGGGRMVQELEGFAAAQRRANGAGCRFRCGSRSPTRVATPRRPKPWRAGSRTTPRCWRSSAWG